MRSELGIRLSLIVVPSITSMLTLGVCVGEASAAPAEHVAKIERTPEDFRTSV